MKKLLIAHLIVDWKDKTSKIRVKVKQNMICLNAYDQNDKLCAKFALYQGKAFFKHTHSLKIVCWKIIKMLMNI